jgi:general secretion pathway protein H
LGAVDAHGFTLIELLVVTFIIAAMIGMVALRLTRDDRDLLQDEADRLLLVLQSAREDSILQGNVLTAEIRPEGYRFFRLQRVEDQSKYVPVDEGVLAPRKFPPRMDVRFELDGQAATGAQAITLDPSGTVPTFKVDFTMNQTHWAVLAQNDGKMCSTWKDKCQPR